MANSLFMAQNIENVQGGFGYLYNWHAATEATFAPTDWKVPTYDEYDTLRNFVGDVSTAGGQMKERGDTHWLSENVTTPYYALELIGSGIRDDSGVFSELKTFGYLWTQTEFNSTLGRDASFRYDLNNFTLENRNKKEGLSIRLLYTGAGTPTTMTDYDGNVYDVILIGTQRWTVQQWKCTKLNDGTPLTKVTNSAAWAALITEGYCAFNNNGAYK